MTKGLFDNLPLQPKLLRGDAGALPPSEIQLYTRIIVPGEPVAKGRPRVRIMKFGGKLTPQLYAPKETQDYEDRVRQYANRAIGGKVALDEVAIGMIVRVFIPVPDSWPQKKKAAAILGQLFPLSRPDGDNYLKMACDALNGIIYRDDSLVTDKHVIKRYSENPRMEIEVYI